ncbi:unnamed protein product [Wickerhamomyces anomalus]
MLLITFVCSLLLSLIGTGAITQKEGYCAIYDTCGKKSLFGSELPCPFNEEAIPATDEQLSELSALCGEEWREESKLCCTSDQISELKEKLKKADSLISSCPACQKNFRNMFCQFTCSPNQSTFVNVTKTARSMDNKQIVTELDLFHQ